MSNLSPQQFNEWDMEPKYAHELSQVSPRSTYAVPTHVLHNAYSAEFESPAHEIEHRLTTGNHDSEHEGNHPAVQAALDASVRAQGMHTPITVGFTPARDRNSEPEYSIVNGSHRYLAAVRGGLPHVPVRLVR